MMKRFFALALAAMLVIGLAACGEQSSNEIKQPSSVSGGESGSAATDDQLPAQPEETPGQNENQQTTQENQAKPEKVTIEEVVLLDEAGVKITAKGMTFDGWFGPALKLLIENNAGQNLTVQCRDASVNGYMVSTMMSADVVDGKKSNDELTFSSTSLERCGITTIADMEFSFHIFNSDSWDTYLDTPLLQIKTSAAADYPYIYDDSGDLVYNKDGIKLVVKGLSEDSSIFGPEVVVYAENLSGRPITVQVRDVSINGFMVSTLFSTDVGVGKRAVDGITFLSSELEENEIETVETIELSFHLFDSDSWKTIVDTDPITIDF